MTSTSRRTALLLPCSASDSGYVAASVLYLVFFVVSIVLAWVLRDEDDAVDVLGSDARCEQALDLPGLSCFRKEAVLRVSTGSIIYLLAQLLAVICARIIGRANLVASVSLAHAGAHVVSLRSDKAITCLTFGVQVDRSVSFCASPKMVLHGQRSDPFNCSNVHSYSNRFTFLSVYNEAHPVHLCSTLASKSRSVDCFGSSQPVCIPLASDTRVLLGCRMRRRRLPRLPDCLVPRHQLQALGGVCCLVRS